MERCSVNCNLPVTVAITGNGLTTLTEHATDVARNQEAPLSESILAGTLDEGKVPFACAAPTPTFPLPSHGILVVNGTATVLGHTFNNKTMRF